MTLLAPNIIRYSSYIDQPHTGLLRDIGKNLTEEEKKHLDDYTGGGFYDLNRYLRGEYKPQSEEEKRELMTKHAAIHNALLKIRNSKEPINYPVQTGYRLLVLPKEKADIFLNKIRHAMSKGLAVKHYGYSSDTERPGFVSAFDSIGGGGRDDQPIVLETQYNQKKRHVPYIGHTFGKEHESEILREHGNITLPVAIHTGVQYTHKQPYGDEHTDRDFNINRIQEINKMPNEGERGIHLARAGLATFKGKQPITVQFHEV